MIVSATANAVGIGNSGAAGRSSYRTYRCANSIFSSSVCGVRRVAIIPIHF